MQKVESAGCRIELFLIAPEKEGRMIFARRSCSVNGDPDAVARKLLGQVDAHWLHSTSWRYETDGVVLTYLAFCGNSNWGDSEKESFVIGMAGGARQTLPFQPRPESLTASDVLSHGMRHLAWLVNRAAENPWLNDLSESTLVWLRALDPQPAGRL